MYSGILATVVALASVATAQTSTKCNPLTSSCPADPGLSSAAYTVDFTSGQNGEWTGTTAASYSSQGVALSVASVSDNPSLYSSFYFLFGHVEAKIKAAPGVGVVSSLVLLSDDLDEIDLEWLGGSPSTVQTNYFGKGNTTTYDRAENANVAGSTTTFHTYAIDWTSSAITWFIDGTPVRTLNYADAVGGKNFPQTPCRVGIGAWPAGASSNEGTVEWAGGAVDFSQGPFVMYTQSISITNYNPATSYAYGDHSGSYQSIEVLGGQSTSALGSGSSAGSESDSGVDSAGGASSATGVTTSQSSTPSTSTSSASNIDSTTVTTVTKISSSSTTAHASSTTSSTATTSAASNASPSTAPNAASATVSTNANWLSSILTSMLIVFGIASL